MAKTLKILLLLVILLLGVLSAIILIEEILDIVQNVRRFHGNRIDLLFPFLVFVFSVPSTLFHIKTLRLYRYEVHNIDVLDSDVLSDPEGINQNKKINNLLWFFEVAFGVLFLLFGLILIYVVYTHPLNVSSILDSRYLLIIGIFGLGLWIILDALRIKKRILSS